MIDFLVLAVAFLSLIVGLNALRLQKITYIESSFAELARQINRYHAIGKQKFVLSINIITFNKRKI